MSGTVKVLLAIFGILVLLLVGVAGAGYWWFKTRGADYLKDTQAAYSEGTRAGARSDEKGCYDRVIGALKTPEGATFSGSVRNGVSFSACLRAAKPVADFCDGVPAQTEFIASATWQTRVCASTGVASEYCTAVQGEVQKYCALPLRGAKLARLNGGPAPGATK